MHFSGASTPSWSTSGWPGRKCTGEQLQKDFRSIMHSKKSSAYYMRYGMGLANPRQTCSGTNYSRFLDAYRILMT